MGLEKTNMGNSPWKIDSLDTTIPLGVLASMWIKPGKVGEKIVQSPIEVVVY